MDTKVERCPNCGNTVTGSFNPSTTRVFLTKIAKTSGMKGLLAYAGSVIPGFGTVSGFLAGAVIDTFYGKDIDKTVNKIADAFEEKKIYIFDCPKCKKKWTREQKDAVTTPIGDAIDKGIDSVNSFLKSKEVKNTVKSFKNFWK